MAGAPIPCPAAARYGSLELLYDLHHGAAWPRREIDRGVENAKERIFVSIPSVSTSYRIIVIIRQIFQGEFLLYYLMHIYGIITNINCLTLLI